MYVLNLKPLKFQWFHFIKHLTIVNNHDKIKKYKKINFYKKQ